MTVLDNIRELIPGVRASAIRHVPHTLDVFATHFPLFPVLPGVMILDDLIAVARLALPATDDSDALRWELVSARRIRYRHFVEPGDSMEIDVVITDLVQGEGGTERGGAPAAVIATCRGTVRVDGRPVALVTELVLRRSVPGVAA